MKKEDFLKKTHVEVGFSDDFVATIGIDVRLLIDGGHVIFQNIDPKNYRGKFGLVITNNINREDIIFQYCFENYDQRNIYLAIDHEDKENEKLFELEIRIEVKNDKIIFQNIHQNRVFDQYIFKNGQLRHLILVDYYGIAFNENNCQREEIL